MKFVLTEDSPVLIISVEISILLKNGIQTKNIKIKNIQKFRKESKLNLRKLIFNFCLMAR